MTILYFMIALGILVLVHEWGHYIVAKISGVWVEKFSIGFGPKILGFKKNGTDYRVAPIPLGGYVKLYGQDPWEEAEGDEKKAEEIAKDPRAFHSKPMSRKLATVLAGPVMNLLLCFILMPLVFMVGRMQPKILTEKPVVIDVIQESPAAQLGLQAGDEILSFAGEEIDNWKTLLTQIAIHPDQEVSITYRRGDRTVQTDVQVIQDTSREQVSGFLGIEPFAFYGNEAVIDEVRPGTPAAKAGVQSGDQIVAVNGVPVKYWTEMTKMVQDNADQPLELGILRNDAKVLLNVQPEFDEDLGLWLVGITKKIDESLFVKTQYGFLESIQLGFKENFKLFDLTIGVLKRLFTGDLSYKTLGGPIQIAKATGSAAKSGFGEFIYLLAFLSLQLGILNLLPVPVLDGGHVVFMLIESIRHKPLSPKVRQVSTQIGMVMLLGLMVVVTINDIDSVWGFQNIFDSIKGMF